MDTNVVVLAVSVVILLDISELCRCTQGLTKLHQIMGCARQQLSCYSTTWLGVTLFHPSRGGGKKTCWDVWKMFEPLTKSLLNLAAAPAKVHLAELQTIQRFTVLLYSRTCGLETANEARNHLFTQGSKSLENIPLIEASLLEYYKRATYQGGHI